MNTLDIILISAIISLVIGIVIQCRIDKLEKRIENLEKKKKK